MAIDEIMKRRIANLVERNASGLANPDEGMAGHARQTRENKRSGWCAAALNVVYQLCPNPESAYRKRAETIASRYDLGEIDYVQVGELTCLLTNLLEDAESGALVSVADRAAAETFDDFLDHAKQYLSRGMKNESGVIAGVVFEDSLRRICRKCGISEKGKKLDSLTTTLAKGDILSPTKAKRARACADVRTKATHAQWDEFDIEDVRSTIEFTEELIASHLET